MPLLIPAQSIGWAITAFFALAAAVGASFFIYLTRRKLVPGGRSWPWWIIAPIAGLGGAAGLCVAGSVATSDPYLWLELVWWLVPGAVITFSMAGFEKSHPGALLPGLLVGFVVTIIFVVEIIPRHTTPEYVIDGILRAAEWTLAGLELSWVAVLLAAIGATISGYIVPSAVPASEWEDPYDGSRFKAIVILAHSQGTVITADLLRFRLKMPNAPKR